jgi:hypothetical protein
MPDFTKAFGKAYDAIRSVTQSKPSDLRLYDDEGIELDTIAKGWYSEEVTDETTGQRVVEIRITDRDCAEYFPDVVFLGFSGVKYERTSAPNPPVNNPREWVYRLKPVGIEDEC